MTPACQYLSDATDVLVEEFGALIDRHFAAKRTMTVEPEGDRWVVAIGETVLWRGYDRQLCAGFIRTFLAEHPNVQLQGMGHLLIEPGHSVRVGVAALQQFPFTGEVPSHVVPIRTPA